MKKAQCDVLIVGGGPAGSTVAKYCALKGLDTILIDAKKEIGSPVQCGEFVPKGLLMHLRDFPKDSIVTTISKMRSVIDKGEATETSSPGYMIDRDRFDQALAGQAVTSGAKLLTSTKAIAWDYTGVLCKSEGEELLIESRIIIGGDGPKSTVGSWIGITNHNLMASLQAKYKMSTPLKEIEFYFSKDFYGGYGWAFPKDGVINVGVGIRYGKKISIKDKVKELTNTLIEKGYIDKTSRPLGFTGGLIPIGGFLPVMGKSNILLVGDAAGATHPITGGGIANAILTGEMAGESVVKFIKGRTRNLAQDYQKNVIGFLGGTIEHANNKRVYMETNWDTEDFQRLISKSWIAFGDYGKKD